jgi:hypothetical protein
MRVLPSEVNLGFLKVYRLDRSFCWLSEGEEAPGLSLATVRDLRVARASVTAQELAALQTDVLAGFVLARAAAGLSDGRSPLRSLCARQGFLAG